MSDLKSRVRELMPGLISDLEDLVRIQSVSADPDRLGEVEESARKTAELLAAEGVDGEIVRAHDGGPPAVIGERKGPQGAPVVLLYAHHDVQPENDPADWDSPPFEPTVRGDRLYGRGAADDKAGIALHVGALRALGDDLPVTVRFFIEGEEEVASRTLPDLLRLYHDRLAADVIVIADAGNWDVGVPALTTSLRGLIRMDVEVRTLTHAVHSGMWGGLVPDAIMALTTLLATLWTEDGSPAVEGLVCGPAADVDYPEERLRVESGAAPGTSWIGTGPVIERLWTRPAITVTGFDAPKVAGASNTLVPVACARVTIRLAPGDSSAHAAACLQEHLAKHVPWGAQLTTTLVDTGEPTVLPDGGPGYAAMRSALAEAWNGVAPVDMGSGGSIPFIAEFQDMFPGADILVTGVEDPDARAHGPNEGLLLPEFERAVLAEALLFRRLGGVLCRGRLWWRRLLEELTPVRGGGDRLGTRASRLEPTGGRGGPVDDRTDVRHGEDGLQAQLTAEMPSLGQFLAGEGDDPVGSVDAQHHAPLADAVHPQAPGHLEALGDWPWAAEFRERADPLRGLPQAPADSPVLDVGRPAVLALRQDCPPHARRIAGQVLHGVQVPRPRLDHVCAHQSHRGILEHPALVHRSLRSVGQMYGGHSGRRDTRC